MQHWRWKGRECRGATSPARQGQSLEINTQLLTPRYKISPMLDKPLEIEKIENIPGTTVLRLHGPLLLGNFFPLQTMVRADNSNLLIVDVTDMPYIDSAGIGCLVGAHVSRENSGRKLILVGANDRLITSLKVTKVEQLFTMAPTMEQAMAHGRSQ